MLLNKNIYDLLKKSNINLDEALLYLLSLHFEIRNDCISDRVKSKVHTLGIVKQSTTGLQWSIPLFEGAETAFEWVKTEYIPLFTAANRDKGGHIKDSIVRMKRFFAENPDVRKEEVIGATQMYIRETPDTTYLRLPHYFIYKGVGLERISDLHFWVEKYRESNQKHVIKSLDKTIR
jgi:hypothetical protein